MKKEINYKILNVLLVIGVIYLLYLMKGLWQGAVSKISNIVLPFLVAFVIAYVLYPFEKFLIKKKISKPLAVLLVVLIVLAIIFLICYFVVPLFVEQLINFLSSLGDLSKDIARRYAVNMSTFNKTLSKYSGKLVNIVSNYISSGSVLTVINNSLGIASKVIITFVVSIYFLSDMDNIRKKFKAYLSGKSTKNYELVKTLDKEIYSYLRGLGIFMLVQLVEYTFLFFIIGHPDFLILGILASLTAVIPYFGGIFTNCLALLIASVISKKLFILTLIIVLIFPNVDGYFTSPKIYGKTNQLPPLLTIFAVTAGGVLYGFWGIVIAIPTTIIIVALLKTYKQEINNKIDKIKQKI